jgi:hypothetical protein
MSGAHWIAASKALGRYVPTDDPYPHLCGKTAATDDTVTGRPVRIGPRDCAACAHDKHRKAHPSTPDNRRPNLMPDTATLREVALSAAARGWHVFPLRPDDKRPAFPDHPADACTRTDPRCRDGHTGWEQRATADPDRIRHGWSTVPYGVGIACGPSGLLVVDLDVAKPWQDIPTAWLGTGVDDGGIVLDRLCYAARQPFPFETYSVRTGRGGLHLYFRHPATGPTLRNTAGERGNGLGWLIDTRAHGGYVVAAGSTVAGLAYTIERDDPVAELPAWLAERLTPAPLPPQRPVTVDLPAGRTGAYLDAAINRQLNYLRQAPDGERNHALYVSAVALGQLAAGGALPVEQAATLLEDVALSIGLTRFETLRTIRSGLAAGARRPRTVAA